MQKKKKREKKKEWYIKLYSFFYYLQAQSSLNKLMIYYVQPLVILRL